MASQLVTSPTTAKGTLIDHVYYNRPTRDNIVEVRETYYSDHDTVYCSIPIETACKPITPENTVKQPCKPMNNQ